MNGVNKIQIFFLGLAVCLIGFFFISSMFLEEGDGANIGGAFSCISGLIILVATLVSILFTRRKANRN